MKQKSQISVVIITLVVMLLLGFAAGSGCMALLSGSSPLAGDMTLEQAKNAYISYEIAHPVASYPEEYYSGDANRIKRMAYIVYDEDRQTFLKVVISEQNKSPFERLLRAANMSSEVQDAWGDELESQLEPVTVVGSLSHIEDSDAMDALFDALASPDFQGAEALNMAALAQSSWFVLEDGYIQSLPTWHYWLCIVVMGVNLLFLLIALISLFRKGANQDFSSEGSESSVTQFLKKQLSWLEPWCRKGMARRTRMAFLAIIGVAAALTALGFYVGSSSLEVITCHLALGLGLGELYGIPLLLGMGLAFDPYKLLKNYDRSFEKLYPIQGERETIAQNLLEADDSWTVREQGKEDCTCTILGERYWIVLGGTGRVAIIDSNRIGRMYSDTISGQVRTGKVRYNYTSYMIYIHYQGDEEKKHPSMQFSWNSESASGHFLTLARKRLGNRAQTIMG